MSQDERDSSGAPVNLAAAIYGAVAVGWVLAIESAKRETYLQTVGAAVVALAILWLGHSYAENTSERLTRGEAITAGGLLATMLHEVAILLGAGTALLAVVVCWVLAAPLTTAVTVGIWTSVATVMVCEVLAAVRAELSGGRFVVQVVLGALLGLGTITLKLILH